MSGGLTRTALSGHRTICKATSLGFHFILERIQWFQWNCIDNRGGLALIVESVWVRSPERAGGVSRPGVSLFSGAGLGGILKEGHDTPHPLSPELGGHPVKARRPTE
mgnify:CR=1 FL=1